MRGIISAAVIAVAIVCGSLMYTGRITSMSNELTEINNEVQKQLKEGDYDAAAVEIERIREYMKDKHIFLSATCNHTLLNDIDMSVMELAGYTEEKQKSEAIARSHQLSSMIERLPNDYRVSLGNIL